MPLYILCPQCQAVPVSQIGEMCEECKARQNKYEREYARKLAQLERKPRGGKNWPQNEPKGGDA